MATNSTKRADLDINPKLTDLRGVPVWGDLLLELGLVEAEATTAGEDRHAEQPVRVCDLVGALDAEEDAAAGSGRHDIELAVG